MKIERKELVAALRSATRRVQILGVVPLDPNWEELLEEWGKLLTINPDLEISIFAESDNYLFSKTLTSDTERATKRRSFTEVKFVRDQPFRLRRYSDPSSRDTSEVEPSRLKMEIMHLDIPLSVVRIDDRIFANLWLAEPTEEYEEITAAHPWHSATVSYIDTYFDAELGCKYSSAPGDELINLYDHRRVSRGIFPRPSFYNTDFSQLVVWALILDRRGRLLIHKRKENAKDNRSMWDKSSGGHFEYDKDLDTSRAVIREVIEELFSNELEGDERAIKRAFAPSFDHIVYAGEWRLSKRNGFPMMEISRYKDEWVLFRLGDVQLPSPRTLPDGSSRRLNVIADVFVFIAGKGLNDKTLGSLMNSEYKLVELGDLKNEMDRSKSRIPEFTPDLTYIMTSKLRDSLEECAQYVKRYVNDEA